MHDGRISDHRFRGLKWVMVVLCVAFFGMQFIRPELKNSPAAADLNVPPQVKEVLKKSCYDCHSNETRLSWFDEPAPAYWIVTSDVRRGRKHLNFSEIATLPAAQQRAILFESVSQIELGAMPLPAYKRLHPGSAVSPEELAILKQYLALATPEEGTTSAQIAATDAEYAEWLGQGSVSRGIAPAPNGIAFLPEYKDWIAISSTERFDNHTMRQILGNDVAVKAIVENRINPWPDGSAFAKVAWHEQADDIGVTRPGAFFQVEFMIRDSKKYARTLGWGWARWRGTELKPYGKDETFSSECVGCHRPLANTNYVFTMPIRSQP